MNDDILEIKPGIGWLRLNLRALWRRLASKPKAGPTGIVARRFIRVFEDHGVNVTQIPRLVTQLTLDQLGSPEALLPALTGDVLEHTARLFGIRRTWLEGVGDEVYDYLWCYGSPDRFFRELGTIELRHEPFPVRALFCTDTLDCLQDREQPIVLLLQEKIAEFGDQEIFRYRVYNDTWNWAYWKSRIQLKATARIVDQVLKRRVPLYRITPAVLNEMRGGRRVPQFHLGGGPESDISLEDYALSEAQTRQSKEHWEIPEVLKYIEKHDLERIARRELGTSKT